MQIRKVQRIPFKYSPQGKINPFFFFWNVRAKDKLSRKKMKEMARWRVCLFWELTFKGIRIGRALTQSSDFEEEKDFKMVCVFVYIHAGACRQFEKSI